MTNRRSLMTAAALALTAFAPRSLGGAKGCDLRACADDQRRWLARHRPQQLYQLPSKQRTRQAGVPRCRYPNALTTAPSDSFPGLLAPTTGGTSRSTGVFYDDSYDRSLFAPKSAGANCSGPPGAETVYAENIDKDPTDVTAGGTLGDPLSQIDPAQLPQTLAGGKCVPVLPHEFINVNTIFEVTRAHGGRTAWADKHSAYEILNGPSGEGVQDLYTPEVNSNDSITGQDTTTGYCSIQRNDVLRVQAILNQINGLNSTGTNTVGVPAIFGMNFQAVSVGQNLAKANAKDAFVNTSPPRTPPWSGAESLLVLAPSGGVPCNDASLVGGYADADGSQLNTGLQYGLDFVDTELGFILAALQKTGLDKDTLRSIADQRPVAAGV